MSKNKKLEKSITRNILNHSLTATVWIFELLINSGILTMEAFLSPSIYKDPAYIYFNIDETKNNKKRKHKKPSDVSIRQSLWRLKKAGFVEKKGKSFLLTEKGKALANYISLRRKAISQKWDKKFRIVIFDIPEKSSKHRDWLRQEVYLLGYKKLQESVYVGKYPLPSDLIKKIKQKKIGNFVNYILAEKIYQNIFKSE
jgi:CRISPR-associated endonuclease Cas2